MAVRRPIRMQLCHDSSNHITPTADVRLNSHVSALGGVTKERDPRFLQLDLMISGQSAVMRNLKTSILNAADCNSTVLIIGESGTGKELIARTIHELGAQQREPFQAIN